MFVAHLKAPGGMTSATAGMGNLHIGGGSMGDIPRPTIRPANPFNCEHDTQVLRTAMKGFGNFPTESKPVCHQKLFSLALSIKSPESLKLHIAIFTYLKYRYMNNITGDL